jgi:PAS domain-containing protein
MTDRWRATLDAIPQMVWAIGPDGNYYNKRWLEFTGTGLGSSGDDRLALVHPEDRTALHPCGGNASKAPRLTNVNTGCATIAANFAGS